MKTNRAADALLKNNEWHITDDRKRSLYGQYGAKMTLGQHLLRHAHKNSTAMITFFFGNATAQIRSRLPGYKVSISHTIRHTHTHTR